MKEQLYFPAEMAISSRPSPQPELFFHGGVVSAEDQDKNTTFGDKAHNADKSNGSL